MTKKERNKITKLIEDAYQSLPDVEFCEPEYYGSVEEVLRMLESWAEDHEQQAAGLRAVISRHE